MLICNSIILSFSALYWISCFTNKEYNNTTSLYIGNQEPEAIITGVIRHSLYSESILLFDPFNDPRILEPEDNPLITPDKFKVVTLRRLFLWLRLFPWIDAGIIKFIRNPGNFDSELLESCSRKSEQRSSHPEIKKIIHDIASNLDDYAGDDSNIETFSEYLMLKQSDNEIKNKIKNKIPDLTPEEINEIMDFIFYKRKYHPYYIDSEEKQEFFSHHWKSVVGYELSRITASLSGSHIISNSLLHQKKMELDHYELGNDAKMWEPISNAFNNLNLNFLNNVPLEFALNIRKKGDLATVRAFLNRIWRSSKDNIDYSEQNVQHLADELIHHVNEAKKEWSKIREELIKWLGSELAATVAAMPHAISSGTVKWLAGGMLLAGFTNIGVALSKYKRFLKNYPAGFFLKLKQ